MGKDELTVDERGILLGQEDSRVRDDYDEEFYNELWGMEAPSLENVNDRIRRAVANFVFDFWKEFKRDLPDEKFDSDTKTLGALTYILLHAYELGRKRKRSLSKKS